MKFKLTGSFDGGKFAKRYKIQSYNGIGKPSDFWIDAEGMLNVRDDIKLPDNPPIFEAPDPAKLTLEDRIINLEQKVGGS